MSKKHEAYFHDGEVFTSKDLPSIIADEITWEGDMYYSQKINLADKQVRYRR